MKTYVVKMKNAYDRTYSSEKYALSYASAYVGEGHTTRIDGNSTFFIGTDGTEVEVTFREEIGG
jgi:hypothetical protein